MRIGKKELIWRDIPEEELEAENTENEDEQEDDEVKNAKKGTVKKVVATILGVAAAAAAGVGGKILYDKSKEGRFAEVDEDDFVGSVEAEDSEENSDEETDTE